jgi:ribosome-binding protein aMBF1 (putative translation factor)
MTEIKPLAEILGIDPESPIQALAYELARGDYEFQFELIQRRKAAGIPRKVLAERLGVTIKWVDEFEAYWHDPKLSEIRRYALAIGVNVQHKITDPPMPIPADEHTEPKA